MNDYHVRLARDEDLNALPDIEREAAIRFAPYGLAEPLSNILTSMASLREGLQADRLWVAADGDDHPIGFALARVVGENAHLDELDVRPAHGQRGLGTALVETVCDWARVSGYRTVTLTTLRHIPWNAPWYQRLGFRALEAHELTTALRNLLHEEIQRALPVDQCVAMRRNLSITRDTRNGRD